MASGQPSTWTARIRVVGAWAGVLEVELGAWTVSMLRAEVARRSSGGSGVEPDRVGIIFGGRVLKDESCSLAEAGLKNNAKVLSTVASPDRGKAIAAVAAAAAAEEEHIKKITRVWEAAKVLSQRHSDGSFPLEDYNIELEDQNGQKVIFGSEADKKAVMMGLMLHANAKSLINQEKYKEALDVLTMAEEAFSLCNPKFIEMIDNVPMLQLDTVWCYFMLRDISCLAVAGTRLEKARIGFERSHGKDCTRFRLLQAGRHADLSIYLRLELLEGVVAYHNGNIGGAHKSLTSAQAKYMQLQVSDEALSLLMGMGYKERAAKRALRVTGQDIQLAVDFLVEERAKKTRRMEENFQRKKEIMEQKKLGKSPNNKAVDMQKLEDLIAIGFEKHLAAEALRINENDEEKALDLLTNPEQNCHLQSKIQSRSQASQDAFTELSNSQGSAGSSTGNSSSNNRPLRDQGEATEGSSHVQSVSMDEAEPDNGRDITMETELANELKGDALADYDIDVTYEGKAIAEYLSLVESSSS